MAEGLEKAAEKTVETIQDVTTSVQDTLILANLTSQSNAADKKYVDSIVGVVNEQEIRLNGQVRPAP